MPRAKNNVAAKRRHKKVLKRASGAFGGRSRLYRTALGSPVSATCEADLGLGTNTVLAGLSAQQGFLVVARNAAGEGSYGRSSGGVERPPADPGKSCP